ncbi:MAG: hypothetical protein IT514_02600 [Burkholderiales bacterium]|nr:hypothetical protein [Burkholderiales bacterium]
MMNHAVAVGGIAYGLLLMAIPFVRSGITEALRIDALLLPKAGESTRALNFVAGAALAGYNAWALLA